MKAIILAAGIGSRMKKYTKTFPKCMIEINNKTILERQIDTLQTAGISNIYIVTGFKSEMINYDNIKYYHNENYEKTNMIESLMCAANEFDQDLIITYGDLIYTEDLLHKLIDSQHLASICVDSDWKTYWFHRYGQTEIDLETLTIDNNMILELGAPTNSSKGLHYRYVGAIKFSLKIIPQIISIYNIKKKLNEKWIQSGKPFLNGYMTDLLNEMIINGITLSPIMGNKQWLEIDMPTDYDNLVRDYNNGNLNKYYLGDLN